MYNTNKKILLSFINLVLLYFVKKLYKKLLMKYICVKEKSFYLKETLAMFIFFKTIEF